MAQDYHFLVMGCVTVVRLSSRLWLGDHGQNRVTYPFCLWHTLDTCHKTLPPTTLTTHLHVSNSLLISLWW